MAVQEGGRPRLTLLWRDPDGQAVGHLVVDTYVREVALAACRIQHGLQPQDIVELAREQTNRFAFFEVPIGGAALALDLDPARADVPDILCRFLSSITGYLRETLMLRPGPGTTAELIINTLRKIGIPYIAQPAVIQWQLGADRQRDLAQVLAARVDGELMENLLAGFGSAQCALEALLARGANPAEATAMVVGFGAEGRMAAKYLSAAGVRVTAVADDGGVASAAEGLPVAALLGARRPGGELDWDRLPDGVTRLAASSWPGHRADVVVATAANCLTAAEAAAIAAQVVVAGAYGAVAPGAEAQLQQRGVAFIPPTLATGARAYLVGQLLLGQRELDTDTLLQTTVRRLRTDTRRVLDGAASGLLPSQVVANTAEAHLAQEMARGGW